MAGGEGLGVRMGVVVVVVGDKCDLWSARNVLPSPDPAARVYRPAATWRGEAQLEYHKIANEQGCLQGTILTDEEQ